MREAALTPPDPVEERTPYVIASALRTLDVLRAFARSPHKLGLSEVTAALGLERNQAYRSLKTLEAGGFLVATDDARFELGPAAAGLGTAAMRFHAASVIDVAGPVLDRLSGETRETVHLFVRRGERAVCVDRRESPQSVRLVSILGRSLPLHAGAVPKAMLAWLPPAEQRALLDRLGELPVFTDRTYRDRDALEAELAAVRARGHSISDEDFDASARGVGAAIFDAAGDAVAGVSVGGPSYRIDDATLERFGTLVRAAAQDLSRALAHGTAPDPVASPKPPGAARS
jgi:IclR family acetate operon transcriptional repressor